MNSVLVSEVGKDVTVKKDLSKVTTYSGLMSRIPQGQQAISSKVPTVGVVSRLEGHLISSPSFAVVSLQLFNYTTTVLHSMV
jgi:hypothetical protein